MDEGRRTHHVRWRYMHRLPHYDTEQWLEERAKAAWEQWRQRRRQLRQWRSLPAAVKALLALAILVFLFVCSIACWILFVGTFLRSY